MNTNQRTVFSRIMCSAFELFSSDMNYYSPNDFRDNNELLNGYHQIVSSGAIIIVMMMKIKLFSGYSRSFYVDRLARSLTRVLSCTNIYSKKMNFYGNGHVHENKQHRCCTMKSPRMYTHNIIGVYIM